jgi:hypothetical protein
MVERVVEGGWEWLRKMLTIANVDNLLHKGGHEDA